MLVSFDFAEFLAFFVSFILHMHKQKTPAPCVRGFVILNKYGFG